jgi:hypothetical protein
MEAWGIVHAGLIADGTVNDVSIVLESLAFVGLIWVLKDTIRASDIPSQNSRLAQTPNHPINLWGSSPADG